MHFEVFIIVASFSYNLLVNGEKLFTTQTFLLESPLCPQLKNLCSNLLPETDDLMVLECIQTFQTSQFESINNECQHIIHSRIMDLITDEQNIYSLISKSCPKDMERFQSCKPLNHSNEKSSAIGKYLGCVLENREQVKDPICKGQVQRIGQVVFSDFRLIGNFVRDCSTDIEKTGCGRLESKYNKLSQGETIACLQENIDVLSDVCKKSVFHLSELQSENIKLDRQLFLSCNTDVQKFCPNMRPGNGGIYKCLTKNKNSLQMSKHCQTQLIRRDKLIANDYRVSKGLAKSCKEDIKLNHCRKGVSEDKDVRLAQILLCLEAAQKNNTKILPDCLAEIFDHRKMLMESYQMSPEIINDCTLDLKKFCQSTEGPETIHCLMEHSRPRRKMEHRVSAQCQRAVEQLVKVSDVGENWKVDPVLRRACKTVVDTACVSEDDGESRIMSCLMEKLGTSYMTPSCETALLQIQYFTSRDFKLDAQLYKSCKNDAVKFCHAKKSWADMSPEQMDPERGPMVLPCLHRYAYRHEKKMQLSETCFQEVKRVMRQRAISVDLIPEVEDSCLEDLATNCFDKTKKGEEMECLQQHLEELTNDCKSAVTTYTEEESEHIELNPLIRSACNDAIAKFCHEDDGDVMDCLISIKNNELKNAVKCRAAIDHFQIISLKNYVFTKKFKDACKPHVNRFCPTKKTKFEVVSCISEIMANDTIQGKKHSIPKICREQIRSQLLQQRENIDFDPKLKAACKDDIKELCNMPKNAGQVLECLQNHDTKISPKCKHLLFAVKLSELSDSRTDYTLMNTCKGMLNQYCADIDHTKVLKCLAFHKEQPLFDTKCHLVVINRMILQNIDYRFNPELQHDCASSIAEYCSKIIMDNKKENEELNGKVIDCLKAKFREGKLVQKCEKKIIEVLHDQALNYKLNPLLATVCNHEIRVLCGGTDNNGKKFDDEESIKDDTSDESGEIEECLKKQFLAKRIITQECKIEVAQLIQEGKADIQVDPILLRSCTVDLLKYCSNVDSGNGRQLKCLQIILDDEPKAKALEDDCKQKLLQRMEMFKNANLIVPNPESFQELYDLTTRSPAKRYFAGVLLIFVGIIFFIGALSGRVFSKRTVALKNK